MVQSSESNFNVASILLGDAEMWFWMNCMVVILYLWEMIWTMIKYFFLRILLLVIFCFGSIVFFREYEEFFLAYLFSILTGLFFWSLFLMIESYIFHQKKLLLKRNLNLIAATPAFLFAVCFWVFVMSV